MKSAIPEDARCCKRVYGSGRICYGNRCANPPKVKAKGEWYCAVHDPESVERRDSARRARWSAEYAHKEYLHSIQDLRRKIAELAIAYVEASDRDCAPHMENLEQSVRALRELENKPL